MTDRLPVLPLRRGVLLPGALVTLTVGRRGSLQGLEAMGPDNRVIIAAQREPVSTAAPSDLLSTATLAEVIEQKKPRNGPLKILVRGLQRVTFTGFPLSHPYLEATWEPVDESWPDTPEAQGLLEAFKEDTSQLEFKKPEEPSVLIDATAAFINASGDWLREILVTQDPLVRADRVMKELIKHREMIAAKKAVQDRVANETRDMQREFVLRQQLDAIRKELGEGSDDDELERLKDRLEEVDLSDEARKVVDRELRRLERLGNTSPERSVALDWLDWISELPWNVQSAVDPNLATLEAALDASHYGLEDVKRQVVEHLSVRMLAGEGRADVLLLVGPPGVGKTSIGQAIADATGRKLVRVALGGVRDEAELRGHRRTYIGARPGRLVEGLRRAGTSDPVVLLDEVDKLSQSYMGNPAAALLEILDPEQNHHFVDHYLEVPLDLSKALFIATANDLGSIPAPLRDRMETIDIAGYTREEKVRIAKDHLVERVARNAGLEVDDVVFTDDAIELAIAGWTREAGVRELQRVLGKVYRAAAVARAKGDADALPLRVNADNLAEYAGRRKFHDELAEKDNGIGIATGLAWTPVGGSILYVEATTVPGNGQLVLTGQLGDVMKESARAALTYVLHHLDVKLDHDIHIHVPAGAVPKDGPSAGVTMFTALASLLSGRPVRADVAMTGEATLRGRVLPVGGIKSKVLAAHRHGVKRLILPRRNGFDLADVPKEALDDIEVVLVDHMEQVLDAALEPVEHETPLRATGT